MDQVAQATGLATGWTARVRSRVSEGVEIFYPLLRVQTGPGVHSTSYKMSFGVKAAESIISHPTSS